MHSSRMRTDRCSGRREGGLHPGTPRTETTLPPWIETPLVGNPPSRQKWAHSLVPRRQTPLVGTSRHIPLVSTSPPPCGQTLLKILPSPCGRLIWPLPNPLRLIYFILMHARFKAFFFSTFLYFFLFCKT